MLSPATAQTWESVPANPDVTIEYLPPQASELQDVYDAVRKRQYLEELQHFLAPLRLPHKLILRAKQCDTINAWYSPSERSLTLCYEYMEETRRTAPMTVSPDGFISREAAISGGLVGVALHEGGHMLFDMLKVPVFGREEDAADQNAAFIAQQFNKDVARTIIKGFAWAWAVQKDPTAAAPMSTWSDEHGKASQRMYNTLCLGYGANPNEFQELVDKGWLPKKRADHCKQEYVQLKLAFVKTILPFIDRDLLARVQQAQWLTPEEMR
jgi:hypothetical protein